jgi:hypothetical protein
MDLAAVAERLGVGERHIRRLVYYPRRLSNTQLEQLSAGYTLTGADRLVADPFLAFEGRFDVPEILDEGETAVITASGESRLIDLDRVRARRYTDEDQKLDFPNDLGFEYVPKIQDKEIFWGTLIPGTQSAALRWILSQNWPSGPDAP